MKRLLRILLNAFTVLSLLLCMVTIVLWARSYWVRDAFTRIEIRQTPYGRHALSLYSESGRMGSEIRDTKSMMFREATDGAVPLDTPFIAQGDWMWVTGPSYAGGGWSPVNSFRGGAGIGGVYEAVDSLHVAHWLIAALFAAVPAARLIAPIRRALRRHSPNNFCLAYGYDLRATPDRCPECGTLRSCVVSGSTCSWTDSATSSIERLHRADAQR